MKKEIRRLWKLRNVEIVPVMIGALGSVSTEFDRWVGNLGIICNVRVMQKTVFVGNCKNTKKSIGNVKREYSVSLWSFVTTRLTGEMTVIATARI